jgi:hypothetical protein
MFKRMIEIEYFKEYRNKIYYILIGKKGAVQFAFGVLDTSGLLFHLEKCRYYPIDVGYHSKKRHNKGDTRMTCQYLGHCYYNGDTHAAIEWINELLWPEPVENAHERIWERLEQLYQKVFETESEE